MRVFTDEMATFAPSSKDPFFFYPGTAKNSRKSTRRKVHCPDDDNLSPSLDWANFFPSMNFVVL